MVCAGIRDNVVGMTTTLVRPPSRVRLIASAATILATVPYLTLKAAWLTGSNVGITDIDFVRDPAVHALNLVTAGMDVLAVVIAIAFVAPFGRTIPAWLLLLPAWVASGLLAPIMVASPLTALVATGDVKSSLPLATWVTPIVYGGFTVQGIGLIVGFVFYAWERWGDTVDDMAVEPAHDALAALATPAATAAVVSGGIGVVWSLAAADLASGVAGVARAAFSFAAAAGVLAVVHRREPGRVGVAAAWLGSAAMFAWGMWGLVVVLADAPLGDGAPSVAGNLYSLLQTVTGLTVGLVALAAVSERRRSRTSASQGTHANV